MFFGECFGNRSRYTDPALSGPGHPRPSPRAPIVAERLWAGAAQKPQAVLEAVVRTVLRPTVRVVFICCLLFPRLNYFFRANRGRSPPTGLRLLARFPAAPATFPADARRQVQPDQGRLPRLRRTRPRSATRPQR